MKNWLSARAHFEVARGSDAQNEEYCSKSGDIYLCIGDPVRERQRNDLFKATEVAKASAGSMRAVAEACPTTFICYGGGLRDYVNVMQFRSLRDFKTKVFVFVGGPGCGKSRMEVSGKRGPEAQRRRCGQRP